MSLHRPDFHALIERFEARLPDACARSSRWLRQPSSRMVRIPSAVLLMLGGVFSILPVLGLWMLPLGLLLLAVDLPALRPPLARLLHWIEKKWPHKPAQVPDADAKNTVIAPEGGRSRPYSEIERP
jgi:hypothetical protein